MKFCLFLLFLTMQTFFLKKIIYIRCTVIPLLPIFSSILRHLHFLEAEICYTQITILLCCFNVRGLTCPCYQQVRKWRKICIFFALLHLQKTSKTFQRHAVWCSVWTSVLNVPWLKCKSCRKKAPWCKKYRTCVY